MYGIGKNKVSIVIAAAGRGTRMGMEQNKQYAEVLGKPILARTIQAFEDCSLTDEIIITANEAEIEYCIENITSKYGFSRIKTVVAGGDTRQQSVYKGLKAVGDDCDIVLIHDGARPFIDERSIKACIEAAKEYGAAIAAVPVKDTIKRADGSAFVEDTLDRSCLWSIQTPQAFQYPLIMEAHKRAEEEGFSGTDDAMLAERLGSKVKLVTGSYYNIKITTREDLAIAAAIAGIGI